MPQTKSLSTRSWNGAARTRPVSGTELRSPTAFKAAPALRLLIVDDDAMLLRALTRRLSAQYDVIATDPVSALEAVRNGECFDAILSDIDMPVLSGLELLRAIRDISPMLGRRVIFMSGGADAHTREVIREANVRLLDKPFAIEALHALLDDVCSQAVSSV